MFGEALLDWNQSPEADVAGYRVYYGSSPSVLNNVLDVGLTATPLAPETNLTTFTIYGTLFFGVTAYDTSNNESGFSNIVSKAIAPKLMPLTWP